MVVRRRQKGALGSFSLTVHATATKHTAVLYHIEHTQRQYGSTTTGSGSFEQTNFSGVAMHFVVPRLLSFPGLRQN